MLSLEKCLDVKVTFMGDTEAFVDFILQFVH